MTSPQVRGAGAWSPAAVRDAIGAALDRGSSTELTGYYRHCGYAVTGQPL